MTHFNLQDLNIWAILVVSVLNMVIGALWYSRLLFGNAWMKGIGMKEDDQGASPVVYLVVFVLGLVIAIFFSMFLQGVNNAATGLAYGVLISLGFVIPTILTHYLMEKRASGFMLIVAGHELVVFMVYGAVLGGWQ